jgi:3-deoxy-D-manno-octulosonate 8-phosphate phosphatase (KDO 8-P phosphatase)
MFDLYTKLGNKLKKHEIIKKIKSAKYFLTDVDGVLTDGGFYYNDTGKIFKKFGPHDSDGFKIIKSYGIDIFSITADKRGYPITQKRLSDMGVNIALVSETERLNWVSRKFNFNETIFVGDGYYDIPLIEKSLLGIAPANAPEVVKASADYITRSFGGNGVIFEIALLLEEGKI